MQTPEALGDTSELGGPQGFLEYLGDTHPHSLWLFRGLYGGRVL